MTATFWRLLDAAYARPPLSRLVRMFKVIARTPATTLRGNPRGFALLAAASAIPNPVCIAPAGPMPPNDGGHDTAPATK